MLFYLAVINSERRALLFSSTGIRYVILGRVLLNLLCVYCVRHSKQHKEIDSELRK